MNSLIDTKLSTNTLFQCLVLNEMKNLLSQYLELKEFNESSAKRISSVIVLCLDCSLLVAENDEQLFLQKTIRHMLLGAIFETQSQHPNWLKFARLAHHAVTVFLCCTVKDISLVKDALQLIEGANLVSVPLFAINSLHKCDSKCSEKCCYDGTKKLILKEKFYSQLITRIAVFSQSAKYVYKLKTTPKQSRNLTSKLHDLSTTQYVCFAFLQLISIQEVAFAYTMWKEA